MDNFSQLVRDLKSRLDNIFYKLEKSGEENSVFIRGKRKSYTKFENIFTILRIDSGIIIHYFDKSLENSLNEVCENYSNVEFLYVNTGI